jgi:cellobiose phosphorylase
MAYDAFCRISPYTKDKIQAIHGAEPYVVSQMIAMPPNSRAGRAMNSWLTGTASWLYPAMAEGILGIKPDYRGLRIDPCVPGWREFRVERLFRGTRHRIAVRNPRRIEKGVRSLLVNGERIDGNLIPLPKAGTREMRVEVEMG